MVAQQVRNRLDALERRAVDLRGSHSQTGVGHAHLDCVHSAVVAWSVNRNRVGLVDQVHNRVQERGRPARQIVRHVAAWSERRVGKIRTPRHLSQYAQRVLSELRLPLKTSCS